MTELGVQPQDDLPGIKVIFGGLTLPETAQVLLEVAWERIRQNQKFGHDNTYLDGTGGDVFISCRETAKQECERARQEGKLTYRHIIFEEFFEALAEQPMSEGLEKELIQLAALAVEWVESIRRRRQNDPNRKMAQETK